MALLDDYKSYASISGTAQDSQITFMLSAIQLKLERLTNRTFGSATYTEYVDGTESPSVFLKNTPISSITSVHVVGMDNAVLSTYDDSEYKYDANTGELSLLKGPPVMVPDWRGVPTPRTYLAGNAFPEGFRNIKVVYVGGYSTLPDDVKLLIFQMVDFTLGDAGKDTSMKSEKLGHYSYERSTVKAFETFETEINALRRLTL